MRINNNLMAMNAYRQLGITNSSGSKAMEKLSSGLRINRAGDDAAGLAISEKMRGQIRGLNQASRNAQDGISLIQTAEGALNETHSILQRMRELAAQSATDTNTEVDRSEIQKEMNELIDEIDRIADQTQFNTKNILDGTFAGTFHIGANEGQSIKLAISNMRAGMQHLVEIDGDPTIASEFDGASVTGAAGFTSSGAVTFSVTHTDAVSATVLTNQAMDKNSDNTGNSTVTISGTYAGTETLSEIKLEKTADGWEVNGEEVTFSASGTDLTGTWNGLTITVTPGSPSTPEVNGDTFTYTGEVNPSAPAKVTAKINGEDVTQAVESGKGEVTYTTASGLSVTADLGTFDFTGETKQITFDVVVQDVPEADRGLQVGQLKVENVTKDSVGGIMTQEGADKAITTIQNAIEAVSAERSKLGAYQNRLEHTIANLGTSAENLQAAESRIRDLDMAQEIMEFTKNNILQQAATAMLAQANMAPSGVLQLLR
jgi:flagellin